MVFTNTLPVKTRTKLSVIFLPVMTSNFTRRDFLLSIESQVQAKWHEAHVFEVDAPKDYKSNEDHYFATFPYPYMNGVLHLGHAFTLSKVEFQCAYQRLKGKRVLFPFAYHVTGMPIAACADKLKRELSEYGCPPVFGESGLKSKTNFQWNILKDMGVAVDEIPLFQDAKHWLMYFPPLAQQHLQQFGLSADFRRSFITTDMNPYYDAFIRWQFNTLKKEGKIKFGSRACIFSPIEHQPCADHDRSVGEGVGIQEFTLLKVEVLEPLPNVLKQHQVQNAKFYLLPATLRPETAHGQTNLWVLPQGKYGIYKWGENGISGCDSYIICSPRAAKNLAYQMDPPETDLMQVGVIFGHELIGAQVSAPYSPYPFVYVLPLLSISMAKGTGIVTSVPSDAPDDYAALMDLKNKPTFREKYKIEPLMVLPYEIVDIIDIPGLGSRAAEKLCIEEKVASQNDREKLAAIKDRVYKEGFAKGVMLKGKYAGLPVKDAKPKMRQDLLSEGLALAYSEPESLVMSRSGVECVVTNTEQWYIDYGEAKWAELVRKHVDKHMETFSDIVKNEFLGHIDRIHEWACSRSYGLGSKLPWDPKYVIESLSDSTIYFCYYAIAKYIHNGNLKGSDDPVLKPEDFTDEAFDYIFLGKEYKSDDTKFSLMYPFPQMRNEFLYWYPMNLRVSGKDLIGNHLIFSLYNHAAIWSEQPELWPKAFYANGHVTIDACKMSKSEGNFITLIDAVKQFGADATRFALAEAGDSTDDANFEKAVANQAILKLTKEEAWIKSVVNHDDKEASGSPRSEYTWQDKIFDTEINICIQKSDEAYKNLQYREVIRYVFHDMTAARDRYRNQEKVLNYGLIMRYIRCFTIMLSPICPHLCQHLWELLALSDEERRWVSFEKYPVATTIDYTLKQQVDYLDRVNAVIRDAWTLQTSKKKARGIRTDAEAAANPNHCTIFVGTEYLVWQQAIINLSKAHKSKDEIIKAMQTDLVQKVGASHACKFAQLVLDDPSSFEEETFDERKFLDQQSSRLVPDLQNKGLKVTIMFDHEARGDLAESFAERAIPLRPSVFFRVD